MEWIRRNWPDLLIGVALLAVIAGIIATLLSGGSFLPFARNSAPSVNQTTTTTNSTSLPPVVGDTATAVGNATTDAANQVGETVANAAETASEVGSDAVNAVTDAAANVANSVAEATESVIAPVIPDLPTLDQDNAASSENTATENNAVEASTATNASTESTSSPSVAVDASSSAAAPYRVSVGAFGNPANAENRAQTFRDAGFPVFLGSQGNLSIVLVGPYDTEFEAEQVRAQISSSGLEPNATVYRYEPESTIEPVVSANTAQAAAETPAVASVEVATPVTTPETTPVTVAAGSVTPPPTASSGRYLQIGAYNSIETSMPQRGRVEGIGYTVVHIEEQGFIKLLVGPYSPENLSVAQAQLRSQGIESFVR